MILKVVHSLECSKFTFPLNHTLTKTKPLNVICWRFLRNLCPFVDLFRTTFPEIRGNSAQKDYFFGNLIEN